MPGDPGFRLPRDCDNGHEHYESGCGACSDVLDELRDMINDTLADNLACATDELKRHGRKVQAAAIAAEVSGGCLNCELHRDSYRFVVPILAHLHTYVQWLEKQGPVVLPESMGNTIKAFEEYCKHFEVPKVEHLKGLYDPQKRESKED